MQSGKQMNECEFKSASEVCAGLIRQDNKIERTLPLPVYFTTIIMFGDAIIKIITLKCKIIVCLQIVRLFKNCFIKIFEQLMKKSLFYLETLNCVTRP